MFLDNTITNKNASSGGKMNKKGLLAIISGCLLALGTTIRADEFTDNFRSHMNDKALDALAQDLGAVMGGGSFHQGKALGFPIGFDVGVHVPVVGVQNDNKILDDDGSTFAAVWGQAELGLPGNINVIGRAGQLFDADMIGGGLRYGLLDPSLPGLPSLSVSALYGQMEHDFFDLETWSANAVLSVDFPFIHPYVGGGFDKTTLDPTSTAFLTVPATVSRSLEGEATGYRVEAGINLSLIPFTYINAGVGLANGKRMIHGGAGIKF